MEINQEGLFIYMYNFALYSALYLEKNWLL